MDIKVERVGDLKKRTLPIFKEVESVLDRIRSRAFEIFSGRGFAAEHALDDWLAAEREICWPAGELVEQDKEYVLSLTLPGFEPADVSVTTTPREVIVQAKTSSERKGEQDAKKGAKEQLCWSEFRSNDVYRRVELAKDIDVRTVSASLKNGILKIVAAKAEAKTQKPVQVVPVSSAA